MKKFLLLIISIMAIFSLVACGQKNDENSSTQEAETSQESISSSNIIDDIKSKGYISVATSPDYPPYEFKIVEGGKEKIVGFDIAIAKEIAKDLGVDIKIVEMGFDGILLELQSGNVDLAVAGFSPSEERKKAVDFSDIYYNVSQALIARDENVESFTSFESLAGKKVGVQLASIQENLAKNNIPNANIVSLSKLPNIILDLKNGNIDAALVELPVAKGYVEQFPNLKIAPITIYEETGGSAFAIRKGNQELVDAVNATIERLKNEGLIDQFVIEANELVGQQ